MSFPGLQVVYVVELLKEIEVFCAACVDSVLHRDLVDLRHSDESFEDVFAAEFNWLEEDVGRFASDEVVVQIINLDGRNQLQSSS